MPDSSSVPGRLAMLRGALSLTQSEFAELIEVIQPTVSKWEDPDRSGKVGPTPVLLQSLERLELLLLDPVKNSDYFSRVRRNKPSRPRSRQRKSNSHSTAPHELSPIAFARWGEPTRLSHLSDEQCRQRRASLLRVFVRGSADVQVSAEEWEQARSELVWPLSAAPFVASKMVERYAADGFSTKSDMESDLDIHGAAFVAKVKSIELPLHHVHGATERKTLDFATLVIKRIVIQGLLNKKRQGTFCSASEETKFDEDIAAVRLDLGKVGEFDFVPWLQSAHDEEWNQPKTALLCLEFLRFLMDCASDYTNGPNDPGNLDLGFLDTIQRLIS